MCFILANQLILKPYGYYCTVIENLHIFFIGVLLYWVDSHKSNICGVLFFSISTIFLLAIGYGNYAYLALFATITLLSLDLEEKFQFGKKAIQIISYIDEHSYALYLMHGITIYSCILRIRNSVPRWETGIVTILATLVATWIGHNLIEIPIKGFLNSKKQ